MDKNKWSRALKSRAIESGCSIYSTMGGSGKKNYTFGFSPELEKFESTKIGNEISGSIYIYNQTDKYPVESRNQRATINQNQDFPLNINNLNNSEQITVINHKDQNIIILQIDNKEIFDSKAITNLINKARKLDLPNKRYVIKNNWTNINKDQKDKIRNILESRAVEFYCCTILNSSKEKYCIQSTKTKGVQYIKQTDNNFVLDLERMKGLDVPWRNKPGMRHFWLEEYLKLN